MEKNGLQCYCCRNANGCVCCKPKTPLDLDAALHELGILSSGAVPDEQENLLRERRITETRGWIEQTPPLWITSPLPPSGLISGQPLKVDTEYTKDVPQQPPNSPVSPQFPPDQLRSRDSHDPLPQRYEWDNRLMGSRRIGMKACHRVLSSPIISDCYMERMRERNSWRPYRIPRPKLISGGHCSGRVRTISATLHEEIERLSPNVDTSQVSVTADAFRGMVLGEGRAKSSDQQPECALTFPRSRSMENLERQAMDVASTTLDSVSEKIEKLHVT